ncbi:hypothetical protein JVU11DRAFT_1137, partial [Chiua virens]
NTNVVKLFAKIDQQAASPKQIVYYSSGISTRPNLRGISENLDMAFGRNIEDIVKDAYRWLADKYEDGDQIYLFGKMGLSSYCTQLMVMVSGFSQGAYQVRVLAGMIYEVRGGYIFESFDWTGTHISGWPDKDPNRQTDWNVTIRSEERKTREIARHFKNTFSWRDLRVHFVGVWDTVSSVGFTKDDVFLSTSSCATHACHFRHTLALDERRVKFMPEKNKPPDIKEVWFAGCHSDVGGTSKPGKSHLSGNVSLLWMRREATQSGLKLQPTDLVWVPADLDFGTSNSMCKLWPVIEYMPITHQVSFSGPGGSARRLHRLQPRRIIPGQKLHASILYANAYKPRATLGDGFDIPIIEAENTQSKDLIWETGLFDETAAQELVERLGSKDGVAPIYLDRLLFMLRFKEGRDCLRQVPRWQEQFTKLIDNRGCAPFVKLAAIVAYYEACECLASRCVTRNKFSVTACDPDATPNRPESTHIALSQAAPSGSHTPIYSQLKQDILEDAQKSLYDTLVVPNHRDGPRIVALLRPLTRHQALRKRILIKDILEKLVLFLDAILSQRGGNLGQAMDGLICLLQYSASTMIVKLTYPHTVLEDTWKTTIQTLDANYQNLRGLRLSRVLEMKNYHHLTAALRMVLALARIPAEEVPQARRMCSAIKPRLNQLSKKDEGLVGVLAVKILLTLDPSEKQNFNISNKNIRANLASALVLLHPERGNSVDKHGADRGQQSLRQLFGLDAEKLNDGHKMLIDDLRNKIKDYNITEALNRKLGKKKIRMSLICLDVFQSLDKDGPWTRELVERSVQNLKDPVWKVQKAGVMVLSALAQTEHGEAVISLRIVEIVEMLLLQDHLSKSPSWMMGPACVLRILAQNAELRRITRETIEYGNLKDLYLSGALVIQTDTRAWKVKTPNRSDVDDMLDKMIKAVDGELSEEDLIPIGDEVLPHIQHWDQLIRLIGNGSVVTVAAPPVLLSLAAISVLSVAGTAIAVTSVQVYDSFISLIRKEDVTTTNSPTEGGGQDGNISEGGY